MMRGDLQRAGLLVQRPARRRSALTIPELIISVTITSLIALSVAGILHAAGYGTSARRDVRRVAVRAEQVRDRINEALRSARAVLASGPGYVVLWTGDTRRNDQVNLSELQLIELPAGSSTLSSYRTRFPAGMSQAAIDAADVAYAANSNFHSIAQAAKTGTYFKPTIWATGVSNFTPVLHGATPGETNHVTWSLTLTVGTLTETLAGAGTLRRQGGPQ